MAASAAADNFSRNCLVEETMRRLTRYLSTALLFAAAACSGITANSNIAPGTNLAQYRTYSWHSGVSGQAQSIGEQEVRSALQSQLAEKGLQLATNTPPDFLVAYHSKKEQKTEVYPGGYGYWGYGWGGFPDVETYTQGTLIVDFIDPKTNKVFWRGTASRVLDHPDNPDTAKIDAAVAKLVQQYPTQMASTQRPAG
jgi:hypothetical protein